MRNFANSLITGYRGAFGAQAITAHQKSINPPQGVSLTVPWYQYALAMNIAGGTTVFNGGVSIDLTRSQVQAPLDIIKSVFIDNTAVDRPVYLRCEDTGQVITCADSSFGWFPVITNGEQFTLFTDNIIPLRDGRQQTRLIFSNAAFDTFGGSEYNRAQALYRASGTSNFVAPTLADKAFGRVCTVWGNNYPTPDALNQPMGTVLNSMNEYVSLFPMTPAAPNTQIVVTGFSVSFMGLAAVGAKRVGLMAGVNLIFDALLASNTGSSNYPQKMLEVPNLQLVLDGSTPVYFYYGNTQTTAGSASKYDTFLPILQYAQITLPALS